jgi:transcriptional regulator with XRE-family HTH domain
MITTQSKKNIGEALRFLRQRKGLAQEGMSKQFGVHRPAYSAWELCRRYYSR